MIQLLCGSLLLLFPYFLILLFSDRLKGFAYVSVFGLVFQLILDLITQSMHVFYYPVVIILNATASLVVLVIIVCRRRYIKPARIGWLVLVPVFAFAVIGFELWTVHYDYTGVVATTVNNTFVVGSSYSYPSFSDEWVNAGLARDSIENASLPISNPYIPGAPYLNLLTPFNSLVGGMFLVLGLDPVREWAVLALVFGLFITAALYALIRRLGASPPAVAIAVMALPFLAESGNLPEIWFLIAFIPGTLVLIFMLFGIVTRDKVLTLTAAALSFVMYPPMMVFIVPALAVFFALSRAVPVSAPK